MIVKPVGIENVVNWQDNGIFADTQKPVTDDNYTLAGDVNQDNLYVGYMKEHGLKGKLSLPVLSSLGAITGRQTIGDCEVYKHVNGTTVIKGAVINQNLPDSRISLGFSADENGLQYYNNPNDPMPINTRNMNGLQKWEETDDYIIYVDKDAVMTTVQNYVAGTYDLFLERKSQVDGAMELLRENGIEWTAEDDSKLLQDINLVQLERVASTQTTMDEPTEIQTFESRTVPTTYECCFRTDKKTGEIYIGEGYENVNGTIPEGKPFVKSVMPSGKLSFVTNATEKTHTFVSDLVTSEFYGVCFTETNGNSTTAEFKVERLGQAVGRGFTSKVIGLDDLGGEITEIQSDFDNCYPWSEMKRVIVDNDLNIVSRFGDANYDPTLSSNGFAPHTHMVMRFTPECYVKRIVLDLSEPYGEKWQQTIICVSKHPLDGYEKHDAFLSVNADGTIVENKGSLINAYEATCVNKNTGIPIFADVDDQTVRNATDFQLGLNGLTNYSDYFLTSYDARNKQAPTSNATMTTARIMTESRNAEKRITGLTYHAHELDMCLFAVEFASLNGQKILGDGISSVSDTPNTANNSATVGYTSVLGNKSGSVQIVDLMRGNNIPVSTQRAVSYRGRENPFGNIWKFLEGSKTGTSGKVKFGIYNPHTANNYADYNANSFVKQTETEQVFTGNSSGYWRVFGHRKSLFIPSAIKNGSIYHGSSSGCRVGDNVWYNTGGGQVARVGGQWHNAGFCGFGCSIWFNAFSYRSRDIGFGLSAHCKEVS